METPFTFGTMPVLDLYPFRPEFLKSRDSIEFLFCLYQPHECIRNFEYIGGPYPFNDQYGNVEDYYDCECLICGRIFHY